MNDQLSSSNHNTSGNNVSPASSQQNQLFANATLPGQMKSPPQKKFLVHYRKPDYAIPSTNLTVDLSDSQTVVRSILQVQRNDGVTANTPMHLDGEKLNLKKISIDGRALADQEYEVTPHGLTIKSPPAQFQLEIEVEIDPSANKSGSGLYKSDNIICTQMEAEGFRQFTYFSDRPDVMSRYTTTVIGDKHTQPVLLSNGNLITSGDLRNGRHFATWEDPFPKPSYLFALVAGDLEALEDTFVTMSGKKVALKIFCEHGNKDRCAHAMGSLKKSMKWDEDVFGLEYDLDVFMIVAVGSFNMGAMENKSLNIFNSARVFADPASATDDEYQKIETVIGHEYFHNYTGNRVTCRDWFQLTLKEGLTVFRDQEFSSDMNSRVVKRIEDVRLVKDTQFAEDAGPNAHPIRPDSFIEIDNFYTTTVYRKGSEVIRMIDTLIGRPAFLAGMKKYFELYDGKAVTTEDFLHAMEVTSGVDLTQFKNWYYQAGTPSCAVEGIYDGAAKTYELTVRQECAPTPGQAHKKPFHFPLKIGLLDAKGNDMALQLEGEPNSAGTERVLSITQPAEIFKFVNVAEDPTPSLLRGFSAPVHLEFPYTEAQLIFLLEHDSDMFNRYEAGQRLALKALCDMTRQISQGGAPSCKKEIIDAFGTLITQKNGDRAFQAEALNFPPLDLIVEKMSPIDYAAAHAAREFLIGEIGRTYQMGLLSLYSQLDSDLKGPYSVDSDSIATRRLKNTCLTYLMSSGDPKAVALTYNQFTNATNMTDSLHALTQLCQKADGSQEKSKALEAFYNRWKDNSLVMDKWFTVQANADVPLTLDIVKNLEKDPAFDKFVPNKIRALYGAFAASRVQFHDASGSGYTYLADKVMEVDRFNPQVASRLCSAFQKFKHLDSARQALMRKELERILANPDTSSGLYEIVSNTVA